MSFSKTWVSSKKPTKQRNYASRAPLHLRGKLVHAHLSTELTKKYSKTSVRVRKGDRVKVMSGQYAGKTGLVEKVDTKNCHVYVEGVDHQKKDGTKIKRGVHVSNVMITELITTDKRRQEILKRK